MNRTRRMNRRPTCLAAKVFRSRRGLHGLAVAGIFLLLAPRALASAMVTGGSGELNISTFICPDGSCIFPVLPECVDDDSGFFEAPINDPFDPPSASTHISQCSNSGASVGPVDAQAEYSGDAQSMTLTMSGSGSENSVPPAFAQLFADADGSIEFVITDEATDVSIAVSMTATGTSFGMATLFGPSGQVLGEITADNEGQHGTFPLGPFEPGTYSIQTFLTAASTFSYSATITVTGTPPDEGIHWASFSGGSFQDSTKWEPEMVPGVHDTAIFDLATTFSVDVGIAKTERLEIRNSDVTFTNANYTVATLDLVPPGTVLDNSVLTLASGTLNGIHILIGESAAARVNVKDGATLSYTGSLQVGGPGNGILNVEDGGFVFSGEGANRKRSGWRDGDAEWPRRTVAKRKPGGGFFRHREVQSPDQRWRDRLE